MPSKRSTETQTIRWKIRGARPSARSTGCVRVCVCAWCVRETHHVRPNSCAAPAVFVQRRSAADRDSGGIDGTPEHRVHPSSICRVVVRSRTSRTGRYRRAREKNDRLSRVVPSERRPRGGRTDSGGRRRRRQVTRALGRIADARNSFRPGSEKTVKTHVFEDCHLSGNSIAAPGTCRWNVRVLILPNSSSRGTLVQPQNRWNYFFYSVVQRTPVRFQPNVKRM